MSETSYVLVRVFRDSSLLSEHLLAADWAMHDIMVKHIADGLTVVRVGMSPETDAIIAPGQDLRIQIIGQGTNRLVGTPTRPLILEPQTTADPDEQC